MSCSCSLRPFEKMTMQRKHRSKGRVLRAQSLQAQFQVLAWSSYLGQIRLCHLPQRAAELSWRTREEETRKTFFFRPQGAHISCRNHLKLFFFFRCLKRRIFEEQNFRGPQENQEKLLKEAPWSYTPQKQLIKGMKHSLESVPPRNRMTAPTCLRTNVSGQLQI